MIKPLLQLSYLLGMILLIGCASRGNVTGGEKDETPPEIVFAYPPANSTNFKSESIALEFDEYVQLNDVFNQILVSPPLENPPLISLKKKSLLIEFDEKLKPNTTYTINFGEGIKDNNEGNTANGLSYVFSTGPFLDSLELNFKILDAFTNQPVEKAKVMLYDSDSDTLPLTTKPTYLGITDEQGLVRIPNLASNAYKAFALTETNSNYLYDNNEENIAFGDSLFVLPEYSDSLTATLMLFNEQKKLQYIEGSRLDSTGFAAIKFKSYPDSLLVSNLEPESYKLSYEFQKNLDSLFVWLTPNPALEVVDKRFGNKPEVVISDGIFSDTISLLYFDDIERRLSLKSNFGNKIAIEDTLTLGLQDGLNLVDTTAIILLEDSLPISLKIVASENCKFKYQILADLKDGHKYDLTVLPNAFQSRSGFAIDTLEKKFSTHETKHFANLKLQIPKGKFPENAYLQRLDENGKLLETLLDFEEEAGFVVFNFKRMPPKTYRFRILYDENSDASWTTGNYELKRQPEHLIYLPEPVKMRSNWNLELEWEFKP